jgi:hypothetical protein
MKVPSSHCEVAAEWCLDFLIPFSERHLNIIGKHWTAHYNQGRPHSSHGLGFPEGNQERACLPTATDTSFPPATRWRSSPCLAACTMNTSLKEAA